MDLGYAAGVNVGIFNLVGMRFRRVPASQIVLPLIKANKAGLDVNVNQLEAHYLAGGNVDRVIDALIAATELRSRCLLSVPALLTLPDVMCWKQCR